jgi:hypothetical protein
LSLNPAREALIIGELSQQLDQRYEELLAGGTSDADARRLAIEALLDRGALANDMRSFRQAHSASPVIPGATNHFLFVDLWQDVRYAARMIRKERGFAAAAVVTLALGIGATTAIFSVVNAVLINPLPYPDSDALVSIVHTVDGREEAYFGDQIYTIYTEQNRTFEAFGVWSPYSRAATVTGQGDPEAVRVLAVSQGLLPALGVRPEIGRGFSAVDDTAGMPDTVILSTGYWRRTFGVGIAVGLGSAAAFTGVMRSLLFGIGPLDPITFTAMAVVLATAALLASYLPARRAVAIDPVETMRAE